MPVNTNEWQKEHPWEPSPTSHPQPVPLVSAADLFNPMLTIAEMMRKEAPTCSPDAPLTEAVRLLRDTASSAIFAVTDGRPVGVLTDRAVALALVDHGENWSRLRVQELMNSHVPTIRAEDKLDVLLDRFTDEGVAVVDADGRLQGVVRWIELLDHLSERALGKLVVRLFQSGHAQAVQQAR